MFAVIDLYGQCAQVTITSGLNVRLPDNHLNSVAEAEHSVTSPFSAATGKTLSHSPFIAIHQLGGKLVFSAKVLYSQLLNCAVMFYAANLYKPQ